MLDRTLFGGYCGFLGLICTIPALLIPCNFETIGLLLGFGMCFAGLSFVCVTSVFSGPNFNFRIKEDNKRGKTVR